MPAELQPQHQAEHSERHWFLRGARENLSVAGLILCTAHIGFAGLALEAGMTMAQAMFMVIVIWALPAMVVLLGAVLSGASLATAAFAVALSSIRLTPMVIALVSELRAKGTRTITPYILAHFIAVTSWVIAMNKVHSVPRDMRTAYYGGLGSTMLVLNTIVVGVVYAVLDSLPATVAAALFLLTPMYFLTSLWGSAREQASHIAMVLGLVLGPALHLFVPKVDLLVAGIVGGGSAYALHRLRRRAP